MRIIFDTNIYLSALIFDNKPEQIIIDCFDNNDFTILLSQEIFDEIKDKFLNGRVQEIADKASRFLTMDKIEEFIDLIEKNTLVITTISKINICRDTKDNMFLELVKDGEANFLITGDKDLLVLKEFEGCKIMSVSEFINLSKISY